MKTKEHLTDAVEGFFELFIVLLFIVPAAILGILLRPVVFLFDRRKYRYPYRPHGDDPLGLWYPFCFLHYGLKENGTCPNCGIKKQHLIKLEESR